MWLHHLSRYHWSIHSLYSFPVHIPVKVVWFSSVKCSFPEDSIFALSLVESGAWAYLFDTKKPLPLDVAFDHHSYARKKYTRINHDPRKERTTTNTYIMKFILPFFVSKVGDRNASCQYVILSQSKPGMWVFVVMLRVGVFGTSKLEVEAIASQYVNRRKR